MPVDLAILDLHLPDGDGSEELGLRLVQSNPMVNSTHCSDRSTRRLQDLMHELLGSIHALIDKRDSFDASCTTA